MTKNRKKTARKSVRKVRDLKPRKDAKGGGDYVVWQKHSNTSIKTP